MPLLTILLALATSVAPAPAAKDVPLPEKIPAPDRDVGAPTVSIRTGDNGDVIEEYRDGGKITMVRITPPHGKPYYLLDTNGDGRLDRADTLDGSNVAPVYWVIYEWN